LTKNIFYSDYIESLENLRTLGFAKELIFKKISQIMSNKKLNAYNISCDHEETCDEIYI